MANCKLSSLALGLSLGVVWGASVFVMGVVALIFTYGAPFVAAVGTLYVGYEPSWMGSVIGGIIGFVDAFIFGIVIAWLYNVFASCCSCGKE